MAGTAKSYTPTEILQGPGDIWAIPVAVAPTDTAVRLTLASDGTPDATTHAGAVHLGAVASASTLSVKPKIAPITIDQFEAPVDSFVSELEGKLDTELAQTAAAKLQRLLGVGTYATGGGYKQVTFGGTFVVPQICIAVISPTRQNPLRYVVSVLYLAVATDGFSVSMGRAKPNFIKASFMGLSDVTRTAGKQIGVLYQTLADAAGGTPTAKDFNVAEIYQGPADLWVLDAPVDATPRVTLAADLTPDATAHPTAVHLGMTSGAVDLTVKPKIEYLRGDQFDGAVDAYVGALDAKIEAEMTQSAMDKLARALGVGTYSTTGGAFAQTVFGGTNQPPTLCVAAIGKKRSDPTKAAVCCLYRVNAADGITWVASRTKASMYKLGFSGQTDVTRTAGKQIGIFHEMV